jgi:hypothetical protein
MRREGSKHLTPTYNFKAIKRNAGVQSRCEKALDRAKDSIYSTMGVRAQARLHPSAAGGIGGQDNVKGGGVRGSKGTQKAPKSQPATRGKSEGVRRS